MKIKPQPNIVQIKIDEAKAGALNVSSKHTAVEYGEVIAVGDYLKASELNPKLGDKIFFKSWAVDIITYNDKDYYFIDITSNGILAIVN